MPRYTDVDEAIKQLERRIQCMLPDRNGDKTVTAEAFKGFLKNRPIADVTPVIHAYWEDSSDFPDTIICNRCKSKFDVWKHERA